MQLLARWLSSVILHYARLAPITKIAEQTVDLKKNKSLHKVLSDVQAAIKKVNKRVDYLDNITERHAKEEVTLLAMAEAASKTSLPLVVNLDNQVRHQLVTDTSSPSSSWVTGCGWAFHRSQYRFGGAGDLPPLAPRSHELICKRCLPLLRLARKREEVDAGLVVPAADS